MGKNNSQESPVFSSFFFAGGNGLPYKKNDFKRKKTKWRESTVLYIVFLN